MYNIRIAFASLRIREIRKGDCAKSKFAYLDKTVLIYFECATIQKRCRRKSARVDRAPGSNPDINSDVSTRYKSPNDAQSFWKGLLSTRRRMNQFLTPVFSREKWKMKSLINQSLSSTSTPSNVKRRFPT